MANSGLLNSTYRLVCESVAERGCVGALAPQDDLRQLLAQLGGAVGVNVIAGVQKCSIGKEGVKVEEPRAARFHERANGRERSREAIEREAERAQMIDVHGGHPDDDR